MKSLDELRAIREKMQKQVGLRSEGDAGIRVVVGMATCGIASGARPVYCPFRCGTRKRPNQRDRDSNRVYRIMPIRTNRRSHGTWKRQGNLCKNDPRKSSTHSGPAFNPRTSRSEYTISGIMG